jgi:hypothetical protein
MVGLRLTGRLVVNGYGLWAIGYGQNCWLMLAYTNTNSP